MRCEQVMCEGVYRCEQVMCGGVCRLCVEVCSCVRSAKDGCP